MENSIKLVVAVAAGAVTITGAAVTVAIKTQKKLKNILEEKKILYIENDNTRTLFSNLKYYVEEDNKVGQILRHVHDSIGKVKSQSSSEDTIYNYSGMLEDRETKTKSDGLRILIGNVKPKQETVQEQKDEIKMQTIKDAMEAALKKQAEEK